MTRKVRTAMVGFLLMSSAASAAWSQDANALIEQGVAMRITGQDEAALRFFQQAWEAQRSGRAQAQIALAEQALGRWVDAETHLAEALGDSRDAWVRERRRALQSALTEIRQHVGQLDLHSNAPGAEVVIGGRVVSTLPMTAGLRVQTGSVTFTVRADGFVPVTRTVSVGSRFPLRETVALEREVTASPQPRAASPSVAAVVTSSATAAPMAAADVSPRSTAATTPTQRYVGFGLIGGGGATLIVAGAFALINAGATSSAAESTPLSAEPYGGWARFQANENYGRALSAGEVCALAQQRSGADAAQVRDLCSSTSSTATIALVAAIAGGALVATGLVLAVTARSTPASTARWGATPWLARELGGAALYATW